MISESTNKLSKQDDWSDRWAETPQKSIAFDYNHYSYADLHKFLEKHLPVDNRLKFLEVGCYPGSFMWYFHKIFGYQVTGIEYVDWCAKQAKQNLTNENIDGNIIEADFFNHPAPSNDSAWDVVFSGGFVEHFDNTTHVLERHAQFAKVGGWIVVTIPNHQGMYGSIMKTVAREKYDTHNLMSYAQLESAASNIENLEIVAGGYLGKLGFETSCLYETAQKKGRLAYLAVRSPLYVIERLGQVLPNTRHLSPRSAILLRKTH